MINLSEQKYRYWQNKLATSSTFRLWWQFWSNYTFIFFVAVFIFYFGHESFKSLVIYSVVAFIISRFIVTVIINFLYKKQRPYQKYKFNLITSKFFSWRTDEFNSFPSRHSITFSSVAVVVMFLSFPAGLILLLATAITGVGRVILGYHWPEDIFGGLIIGSTIGYLISILMVSSIFT